MPPSQDDWQRQVEAISSIKFKHLTTEPDSSPTTPETAERESAQESYYEVLWKAIGNYLANHLNKPFYKWTRKFHNTSASKSCETKNASCDEPKQPLLDDHIANHVQFDKERNLSYLSISTSLTLKRKRHMYYMPMDFAKLTLAGLIDTGALASAAFEQDLNKIK